MNTVCILEKKDLGTHLKDLPCVESPTKLSSLLHELEDAGEACKTAGLEVTALTIDSWGLGNTVWFTHRDG